MLWTLQVLLALLFLFAGIAKLTMPLAVLEAQAKLPGLFLRFIGVCETLGGLGLILPGLLRVRRGLTPLAAAGLVIVMVGATAVTVAMQGPAPAMFPFAVGALCASVAFARRSWWSAAGAPSRVALQPVAAR